MAGKIERKYLAHYIDVAFDTSNAQYVRLGKDLETYAEELNPQVEVRKNILGEQSVTHNGYEVQSSVEPFYCYEGDPLFTQLAKIVNERLTGDDCKTTRVEALLYSNGTTQWAYREDCVVVPQSMGGDTSGMQIPFQVLNCGNRTAGTWTISNGEGTFTPTPGT
jgi:hypothetical protein